MGFDNEKKTSCYLKKIIISVIASVFMVMGVIPMGSNENISNASRQGWSHWAGTYPPDLNGYRWGFGELWWYQRAHIFSYGAETRYRAEDAVEFWVEGRAEPEADNSLFGVRAQWYAPLEEGYKYMFIMRFQNRNAFPDFITLNDRVVWTSDLGYDNAANNEIAFTYVPKYDLETANINLITNLDADDGDTWKRIDPPDRSMDNNFISYRNNYSGERPEYEVFELPEGTEFTGVDPNMGYSYYYNEYGRGIDYKGYNLVDLPYPGPDVKAVERWLPAVEAWEYYTYPQIDIATYQPYLWDDTYTRYWSFWSDAVIRSGTKNIAITPLISREHTMRLADSSIKSYQFFHIVSMFSGNRDAELNKGAAMTPQERIEKFNLAVQDMAELAKDWLTRVPDGEVYIFNVECEGNYGLYNGGAYDAVQGRYDEWSGIREVGRDAWEILFDFEKEEFFNAVIQSDIFTEEERSRISTMSNLGRAAFQAAYPYHGGADVVFTKNIHRQSINVVVSNARGAADAYEKKFGLDFDNWDRQYQCGYHPDEIAHTLRLYFHSGADYIMDEIFTFNIEDMGLTQWGREWLEFWHYAKNHPHRGDQQVRIGIMRPLGDQWNRVAGPSASWEAAKWFPTYEISRAFSQDPVPQKWAKAKLARDVEGLYSTEHTYMWDFDLLNIVFSSYGNPYRTTPDRQATGTPYGPVNFIPWDTPTEKMNEYDVVIYMGRGVGITEEEKENLTSFVREGGKLVMAAGQLRNDENEFDGQNFMGITLGPEKELDGLPYTLLEAGENGEVITVLENNDPEAVMVEYQKGTLYLFSGEWLNYWDNDTPKNILTETLEKAKVVDMDPQNDRMEYTMRKKGESWIFTFFNHGRGLFPSGNGKDFGPWEGDIFIDLLKTGLGNEGGLEAFSVNYERERSLPFSLNPVEVEMGENRAKINMEVADIVEVVIGPKGKGVSDFWGIPYFNQFPVDAGDYDESVGIETVNDESSPGTVYIRSEKQGAYAVYRGISPGEEPYGLDLRVRFKDESSFIEVRLDGPEGELLEEISAEDNRINEWITVFSGLPELSGRKDICIVFRGGDSGGIADELKWLTVYDTGPATKESGFPMWPVYTAAGALIIAVGVFISILFRKKSPGK